MDQLNMPILIAGLAIIIIFQTKVSPKLFQQQKVKANNQLSKEVDQLRFDANDRKVKKFGFTFFLPSALTILRILNLKQFLSTFWRSSEMYAGDARGSNKFVIFAIYEKGEIRRDIRNALEVLTELGYSVVLVNSRKLSAPARESISKIVFNYIERPNYGRDFGSYKDGINWLCKSYAGEYSEASRILFLNDSVFYSRKNLDVFFNSLMETQYSVFGATINYQKIPHIGSFCLSVDSSILMNREFLKFWKKYRKTDLRAHTIKFGELALSKLLARLSISDPPLNVLYSGHEIVRKLTENEELLRSVSDAARRSNRCFISARLNIRLELLREDELVKRFPNESLIEKNATQESYLFAGTFDDGFQSYKYGVIGNDKSLFESYKKFMVAFIGEEFEKESQIHQNATILPILGCPIIKLDLEFRGVTSAFDRITICNELDPEDAIEFSRIISSKPWGEICLSGWRLSAFQWGHL